MERKQRLELNWIGKDEHPRLEPRILLMEPERSYCGDRPAPEHAFDNRLIFGDNLLALKALETDDRVRGKVKCVYIDPPFNTRAAFDHYDDNVEHSTWLSLMSQRLEIIHYLLSDDGALFVHLDDNELDYCKALLDEIFGRSNFINRICIEARSPSAFSTVNPGVFKASEYILWYAKNRSIFKENSGRVPRNPDYAYDKWLLNPNDPIEKWQFTSVTDAYQESGSHSKNKHPKFILEKFDRFMIDNADHICRLASISDTGAGAAILEIKRKSQQMPGKIFFLKRDGGLDNVYVLDGQQLIFYAKNVANIDGKKQATRLLTNVWTDIAWEGIASEGGVQFKKGKKPEKLLRRCIELTTNPGDLVLDSFGGSGTTGAVAHKMGRRWIMVELGEHCHTHIIPRLKKVIDGQDPGGITKAVGWKGGGGFRYFRLAPSLLEKDHWGNWVISRDYNAAMLAEAMCKHMGYTYAPSQEPAEYWRHGQSSERDFIYVTTASLSHDQLKAISLDVGPKRTLLICCKAFSAKVDEFENLTIRKIPLTVLSRCEWGRDDYSLKIISQATVDDDEEDIQDRTAAVESKKRGRKPKAKSNDQPMLALGEGEK